MKYQLKQKTRFTCGFTSFDLSTGAIVEVKQYDKENHKILIDFGDRLVDWFNESLLDRFTPLLTGD